MTDRNANRVRIEKKSEMLFRYSEQVRRRKVAPTGASDAEVGSPRLHFSAHLIFVLPYAKLTLLRSNDNIFNQRNYVFVCSIKVKSTVLTKNVFFEPMPRSKVLVNALSTLRAKPRRTDLTWWVGTPRDARYFEDVRVSIGFQNGRDPVEFTMHDRVGDFATGGTIPLTGA